MHVDEFTFDLPPGQIAQYPPATRGTSRLMVLERATGIGHDEEFGRLPQWLRAGDLLVRNDTRVIPARLRGEREGGGAVELLLLRREAGPPGSEVWSCLAKPGRRLRVGAAARLHGGISATWLDEGDEDGVRRVRLQAARPISEVLDEVGQTPLPPYIDRPPTPSDHEAYQTVYARAPGAVAAPTAGLHFTPASLESLRAKGVEIADLTLHVGPGTFLPVRTARIEEHRLAPEPIEIPQTTALAVAKAIREGRRVVAVGTTTVRALEAAAAEVLDGRGHTGEASLFIVPGYRMRIVSGLITNFHLPRSTLLMLVAAFAGRALVLSAYRDAVARGYRFYSYGDAMLIV
jgi:S-adenosylmethionine:tRNA ribosyltransferase-isomerase